MKSRVKGVGNIDEGSRYWEEASGDAFVGRVGLALGLLFRILAGAADILSWPVGPRRVVGILFVAAFLAPLLFHLWQRLRRRGDSAPNEPTLLPPGWYPDPSGAQAQRYWDGRQWTASGHRSNTTPERSRHGTQHFE